MTLDHEPRPGSDSEMSDEQMPSGSGQASQLDEKTAPILEDVALPIEDKGIDSTDSSTTDAPVSDLRAWLQILGAFFVFANVWGFTFAFGSFQSYYELEYLKDQAPSSIAWIGTISAFLLVLTGVFSGPLFDLGYLRTMLWTGATLATLGVFLQSISHSYWALILTQSVMQGLGNGLIYLPGIALVNRAAEKHRSIGMASSMAGGPVGGIVYTLLFERLIGRLGFGWTIRVLGLTMLASYALAFPLILLRATNLGDLAAQAAPRRLFDRGALLSRPFWAWSLSMFFILTGYIIPFAFVPSYAQTVLGLTRTAALNILLVSQAASTVGRLVVGASAARCGVMLPWLACAVVSATTCFAWIAVRSSATLYAVAVVYGFFSSPLMPLPPAVFSRVCTDKRVFGARLGMAQALNSIGNLVSAPVAAAAASASTRAAGRPDYLGLQLYCGTTLLIGALLVCWLWVELYRRRPPGSSWMI